MAATGSLTALAGCAGVAGMELENVDSRSTAFGNIIISAVVVNRSESQQTKTILAEVDVEGGHLYTRRKRVTLEPRTKRTVELKFDIDMSESLSGGRYKYRAEIE